MDLEDFLELGLKGDGSEVLEIYWQKPKRDSPDLVMKRQGDDVLLDVNRQERGFLVCYYLRLVREVRPEYKDRNVEPPFIEVCQTKEYNGGPSNRVQIPLAYITRRPIVLILRT